MVALSYRALSENNRPTPPTGIKIALESEEEARALLADLSSTPCTIPYDCVARIRVLQCYSEESNLTVATLLQLCSRLPGLRMLDVCNLEAQNGDLPGLVASILSANSFPNVTHFMLGSYLPGAMCLTAAYALISSMPRLQRVELDMYAFPWQEYERGHIENLDLGRVRLRSYTCGAFFFRCAMPIIYSADTLEHLELVLDDEWHTNIASNAASVLCTRPFARLRALDILNEASAFQHRRTTTDAIGSIFKAGSNLRRVFVRCSFKDLDALLGQLTAPLGELAICAMRGTASTPDEVDAGLAAVLVALRTAPALRSLRRLYILCDDDDTPVDSLYGAGATLQSDIRTTCAKRRIVLGSSQWHDGR